MLRERLEAIDVDVRVETFEEGQGIAALGDDPFVSCSCTCRDVLSTLCVYTKQKHSELHQCFLFIHTYTKQKLLLI